MILPRSKVTIREVHLPPSKRRRSCQCEEPAVEELAAQPGAVMPRGNLPTMVLPGYVITEPEEPITASTKITPASLRLCRACAVELALAILEHEVA